LLACVPILAIGLVVINLSHRARKRRIDTVQPVELPVFQAAGGSKFSLVGGTVITYKKTPELTKFWHRIPEAPEGQICAVCKESVSNSELCVLL
jgi:hypothetical protein